MNPDTESTRAFVLRRSVGPYVGFTVILVGVTGLMVFVSLKTRDWTPLEMMSVGWFFLAVIVYIGTRYRIFWRDGAVVQRASGRVDVSIKPDEITRVEQETSDVRTLFSFRRPFRRITIYAEKPRGEGKYIDVSLKHFVADDVRKLMRAIHARRADLTLPKHWM
jgi:hypothetical protein